MALAREGGGEPAQASLVDMSLGGVGLEHVEPFAPGERLVLSFASPHRWDPLVVRGVVVWAHPPRATGGRGPALSRFGVAFEHAGSADVLDVFTMLVSLA